MENGKITIKCPKDDSGLYGIELQSKQFPIMKEFVNKFFLLKEWWPFFQGGSFEYHEAERADMVTTSVVADWALIEFWSNMDYQRQTALIALAERFANDFGLKFDIR